MAFFRSLLDRFSSGEESNISLEQKQKFWCELLRVTRYGTLCTLLINCLFLVLLMYVFNQSLGGPLENGFKSLSHSVLMWLEVNLYSIVVFIYIQFSPESSAMALWTNMGNLILLNRFYALVISIYTSSVLKIHVCFVTPIGADDGSFLVR
jgi:hypothetical protein